METYRIILGIVAALLSVGLSLYKIYKHYYPKKKISWKEAEKFAEQIANKLTSEDYTPSMIFCIGRGGAIFGAMISGSLGHCPLILIDRQHSWSPSGRIDDLIFPIQIPNKYLNKVLLVAGPVYTGGTIKVYYDYLKFIGAKEVRRAVLLFQEGTPIVVEYFGVKSTDTELLLPWMSEKYAREDKLPSRSLLVKETGRILLYLVRHAETEAGTEIILGRNDSELSINGLQQAIEAGKFFSTKKIRRIYSSPLKRAITTALIIKSFINTQLINTQLDVREELKEMDFGNWDGVSRQKIMTEFPEKYGNWVENPVKNPPPEAESAENVLRRVQNFLTLVESEYKSSEYSEYMAVFHKTAIRILLHHIEGLELKNYRTMDIENCEIIELSYDGQNWSIRPIKKST